MNKKQEGLIFVVSGPSGVGKSSLISFILSQKNDVYFSVSCTTRKPRTSERDKKDYYFISQEEFQERILRDEFLEYAKVHNDYYGTLKQEVIAKNNAGIHVVIDIDTQGMLQIKAQMKKDKLRYRTNYIFIAPPSYSILEQRLLKRGSESTQAMQKRLQNAHEELKLWKEYDYLIINDDLDEARMKLKSIIDACTLKIDNVNIGNNWPYE